jgi:hypothetical protein
MSLLFNNPVSGALAPFSYLVEKKSLKKIFSPRVDSWPYPQLDYAGKACQGQTL